jgi:hypothetical protein
MAGEASGGLFPGGDRDPLFLMEAYWPGVSRERIAAAEIETDRALAEIDGRGTPARLLGSMLVPADELLLSVFAGGSLERITAASVRAGVPVERVVPIVTLESSESGTE